MKLNVNAKTKVLFLPSIITLSESYEEKNSIKRRLLLGEIFSILINPSQSFICNILYLSSTPQDTVFLYTIYRAGTALQHRAADQVFIHGAMGTLVFDFCAGPLNKNGSKGIFFMAINDRTHRGNHKVANC